MPSLLDILKTKDKKADKKARRRAKLDQFISSSQRRMKAATASEVNTRKVTKKRIRTEEARGAQKAASKRRDRMLQLAKMPGNKGATELKRLRDKGADKNTWAESRKREAHSKDAGLKEAEIDKKERQRKAQLKGMPNKRGEMPDKKKIEANAKKQEAEKQRQSGVDKAAQKAKDDMAAKATKKKAEATAAQKQKAAQDKAAKDRAARRKAMQKKMEAQKGKG